jgi:hypothetical protein
LIKTTSSILAAGLILAGAVGDHLITTSSSVPAQAASANVSTMTAANAQQAVDTATEHAFAVASPAVVFGRHL